MRVRRRFRFEAAHRLPQHPGKCRELHGHSFELVVTVERPVDLDTGLALDFGHLRRIVDEAVVADLDHRYLNDLIDNPTAERIAMWIWDRLLPLLEGLDEIELYETRNSSVVWRGER